MNGLLLDTHTLLWYGQADAQQLSPELVRLIQQAGGACFASRASLWEVTIKYSIGKLVLPTGLAKWLADVGSQFQLLELADAHLLTLSRLPQIKDHRDPFDRLLIAQALSEDLTLVSRDGKFAAYPSLMLRWD